MIYNARMVHRQTAHPEIDDSSWRSTSQRIAQARKSTMYTVGMLNRVAARIISEGSEDYIAYQTPARMGMRTYLDGNSAMTIGWLPPIAAGSATGRSEQSGFFAGTNADHGDHRMRGELCDSYDCYVIGKLNEDSTSCVTPWTRALFMTSSTRPWPRWRRGCDRWDMTRTQDSASGRPAPPGRTATRGRGAQACCRTRPSASASATRTCGSVSSAVTTAPYTRERRGRATTTRETTIGAVLYRA